MNTLTSLIHGNSGVGKSRLGDTTPAPRLVLDAEGGTQFTLSQPKIVWDPVRQEPPKHPLPSEEFVQWVRRDSEGNPSSVDLRRLEVANGAWETARVLVREYATMQRVYQWLNSGSHAFISCVMDSLTEIQKKCKDQIKSPGAAMQTQDWGTLLDHMENLVRAYRDLTMHPVRPLQQVTFLALSKIEGSNVSPLVQGQLGTTLPGFVDVVGYMYAKPSEDGSGVVREVLVQPLNGFVAKDRTDKLGTYLPALDLAEVARLVNEEAA